MSNEMEQDRIEKVVDQIGQEMLDSESDEHQEVEVSEQEVVSGQEEVEKDFSETDQMRMLEAILFASSEPISPQAILERLPEGADLNVLLPELKRAYEGRGVELVEIGGQWALRTAADVGEALTVEKEVTRKMSKAALETMSIIAYHQPITRAEIENIRGVATHKGTLDILMEMGWVKPGRRRETPGRPLTWMTTTKFLDHFQLESIIDLPGLDDLKASGLLDRRAAVETIPDTADLFDSGDIDAEEVLSEDDDDAYDEESYKEIKARSERDNNSDSDFEKIRDEEFKNEGVNIEQGDKS